MFDKMAHNDDEVHACHL